MADTFYYEGMSEATPGRPTSMWPKVKLIDNQDGTHSLATRAVPNSYQNISGAATTVVKSGAGVLKRVVVNKCLLNGVVALFDGLTASGTKIGTISMPSLALLQSQVALDYDVAFTTGLTVQTTTAQDVTVIFV